MDNALATTAPTAPRLAPLERKPTFLVWLLALVFRFRLGKVMTPLKVWYARMPALVLPQLGMYRLVESGLHLDPLLVHALQLRISIRNGCTFCADLHEAVARRDGHAREKLASLGDERPSAAFGAAEVAALAYADEIQAGGASSDAAFAALAAHFDERQIVEISWVCAFTIYLNTMAKTLGIGSDGFCALADAEERRR